MLNYITKIYHVIAAPYEKFTRENDCPAPSITLPVSVSAHYQSSSGTKSQNKRMMSSTITSNNKDSSS